MEDVHSDLLFICQNIGALPSEGARHYLRRGTEIPDVLLPGRTLQRLKRNAPKYYEKLINTNWQNVAPWWIKVMCS